MSEDIFEGGRKLPLMEMFYTVQGEGFHSGKPSFFIRIGGCDIGCSWCDSKFSWNATKHPLVEVDTIVKTAVDSGARIMVVTGGEPTLYELSYLTEQCHANGLAMYLETSGAYRLSGQWDWICLSPKKQNPPQEEYYSIAGELKVIIHDEADISWAEENASKIKSNAIMYLQPEWSMRNKILPSLIEYVKVKTDWRISLQTHKYIGIP